MTSARKRNTFIMTADTAGKCKDAAFWVYRSSECFHYSVLGCNFPKSYFVLITGSNSKPMRLGSVGIVLVFTPCEFDSTITATPLSKCISPKNERLNVILEYSRGKTEFINIFCRNTLQTYIYCSVLDIILALRSSNNMPFYYTENVSWWDKSTILFL